MEQTPPGWYPHPDGGLRWWNGQQWANPPSVTPPASTAAKAEESPASRLAPTVWTPTTTPPQQKGASSLPKGRGRGRTVALVIGGLVAASFIASEVEAFREDAAPELKAVAAVSDPANGCRRFLSLFTGLLRDKPNDAEADRRVEQLRDAARDNDPLLANDLQDMLSAGSAADVSAAGQIIMRRCVAAGHITQDDVAGLGAAAMSALGAASAPPKPPPPPPPPPRPAEPLTDVAGGVNAAQEACELFAHMFSVDVPIEESGDVFQEAADASQRAALADPDSWLSLRDAMHAGLGLYTSVGSDGDAVIASFEEIGRLCDGFIDPPG